MATTKKTATKSETKVTAKEEAKTATAAAKKEAAPATKTAKKETAPKAAKKTAAKKTEAKAEEKKTAAKKTTAKKEAKTPVKKTTTKKTPSKKAVKEPTVKVYVEFNGVQVAIEDVINNVKLVNGNDAKEYSIYLKPEEQKAYFTADGEAKEMDVFFC